MIEPTPAEIVAFAVENGMHVRTGRGAVKFALAVLEKWGTPAVAGEVVACGNCGGTGWMVRDPDIGTDQECFVCDGSGRYSESATPQPTQAQAGAVPQCWCLTCRPMRLEDPYSIRMALCPTCGNKRCPKANDHRNECTGSNEPGQPGSAYAHGIKGGQHGTE